MEEKLNVYQMVTDKIVEQLEKGIIPWHKPWSGAGLLDGGAINYVSRRPYSLINQFILGRPGEYLTFRQIQEAKGSIKKGVKSKFVVFYTQVTYTEEQKNEQGEIEKVQKQRPVLRFYNVFHIEDCEGIESKVKNEEDKPVADTNQPIEAAENIINEYLAREPKLKFKNDAVSGEAYYSQCEDMVVVPKLSQYEIVEEYYSTTFHELTHSTLPAYRCDRRSEMHTIAAFGSKEYSREELVAELGSAMLCSIAGLDSDKAFKNSVAYIQNWLEALKNDIKMIVWASSRAEKASKYILGQK